MIEEKTSRILRKLRWVTVGITTVIAGLLTCLGIYWFEDYGISMFVLVPVFIGFCSTTLYSYRNDSSWTEVLSVSFTSLSFVAIGLMAFALEGVICIIMAAPIAMLFTWIGAGLAFAFIKNARNSTPTALLILFFIIPTTAFIEKDSEPEITSVITSIEIDADRETVWKNVIAFPKLAEPTEFIFKTGIAYPIDATINGTGKGAIRYCNFSTGSFVEPITIWNEPLLLQFDVQQQPATMKELSFWDIDAPHLHDYFVSKRGQFKLIKLSNGNTLLEGTTWYTHDIKPQFYWELWSEHIIHKIHSRVLNHIKVNSEK